MAITYPLTIPSHKFRSIRWNPRTMVAKHQSPFTAQMQTYVWPAQWWEVSVALPPMKEATADDWVAFMLSLNGPQGYFQMGDSVRRTPLAGTFSTPPYVELAAAAGDTSIRVVAAGGTFTVGDWFSLASDRYLHKILKVTSVGGDSKVLDIFPRLRAAVSPSAALGTTNPMGYFRLKSEMNWSVDVAKAYGIEFEALEYLPTV